MAKEYSYKRYQLSLDESDIKQKQIIEYLESYKAGKTRNSVLIKLLLVALGENIDIDALPQKSSAFVSTEARLKRIDKKLDTIVWNLINRHGFAHIDDGMNDSDEFDSKAGGIEEPEPVAGDNQVPGQLSFSDVVDENNSGVELESQAHVDGLNAEENLEESNIEHNKTLETIKKADEISKELVASAFSMSENSNSSAYNGYDEDEDDSNDIEIPDDIRDFLDSL